jgi:hypothetical protein
MFQSSRNPNKNLLPAAIPAEDYERLSVNLDPVTFSFGEVVYEPRPPGLHWVPHDTC